MAFPNFVLSSLKVKNNYVPAAGTAKVSNLYLKLKTTVDYRDLPVELQSNIYAKVSRVQPRLINYFTIDFQYLTSELDYALRSFTIYMSWVDITISKQYITYYFTDKI